MASITTVKSGNWSDNTVFGPWPSPYTVPAGGSTGDDVTIAKNHTVTLDTIGLAAKSIALAIGISGSDVGGILTCTTSANWALTIYGGITANGSTTSAYSSTVNLDMSASAYTGTLVVNNASSGTPSVIALAGNFTLKGAAKKRWATLATTINNTSDVSATVTDATGWNVGDRLVIAATGAPAWPPLTDEIVLTSVDTGTGAIGWSGVCTNEHLSGAAIGNFSSNLIIKTGSDYAAAYITARYDSRNRSGTSTIRDVEFYRVNGGSGFQIGLIVIGGTTSNSAGVFDISNNAFYDIGGRCTFIVDQSVPSTRDGNAYYMRHVATGSSVLYSQSTVSGNVGPDTNYAIFRANGDSSGPAIYAGCVGQHQTGADISGLRAQFQLTNAISLGSPQLRVENSRIYGVAGNAVMSSVPSYIYDTAFGADVFTAAVNGADIYQNADLTYTERCTFGSADFAGLDPNNPNARIILIDKDGTAGNHEIYGPHSNTAYTVKRVTDTIKGSTSSLEFQMTATTPVVVSQPILAKAGSALRIMANVRKSNTYGASTLPYIKLSGLGITPVMATMSAGTAADTWELLTLDMDAGSAPSVDGLLTLEIVTQSATSGAKAWVSGLPYAQFVTRVRHYGYVFDETSATRTVDVLKSADFATADAYTGMSITWGASSSSIALTGNTTFQKLYDYHQAKATQNVGSALALTGAGVVGSPALFAAGNITTTGYALNGPGSLSIGSSTLTAASYTFTGGTFAQAEATPSFTGGVLSLPAAGSYVYSIDGGEIEFGAASTAWNLSDSTFSGTVHFSTSTGSLAVTVAVPAGLSYTTEGANIIVTEPVLSAPITWAGALNGTTVLLYNDSNAGAIIDTQTLSGAGGYTWDITLPHADVAVGDSLRLRFGHKEYYAGELQGTMTASGLAFVGSMTLHPIYAAWGLTGSDYDQANGGPYTMDGANLQIDISVAGTVTGLKTQLGAWTQYLMTLPAGLDAFYGAWDLLAANQIRQNVSVVDVLLDLPTAGAVFTLTDNNVNYYRSDFSYPAYVGTGHGLVAMTYDASPFVATVAGGDVVTGTPTTVAAAVRSELTSELTRISDLAKRGGVVSGTPVVIPPGDGSIVAGDVEIGVSTAEDGTVTLARV